MKKVEVDDKLTAEIEDLIFAVIQDIYPDKPREAAMALQRTSLAIQEATSNRIPNEEVSKMRRWAKESIDKYLRQLSEIEQIMFV